MTLKHALRCALVISFSLALVLVGCHRSRQQEQRMTTSQSWNSFVDEFLNAHFMARPDFAVRAGRHEFDGKLPDWSAEGIAKEIARLHSERTRAAGFKDDSLDERQRFER